MKKLLILLIIILNLSAKQSCKDYDISVDNYVIELLMQSSVKNRLKEAHYFINGGKNSYSIQAFLDIKDWVERGRASSVETIGWFTYDMNSFKLYEDMIVEPAKPIEIHYEKGWKDVITTVSSQKSKECIEVKKKSWLYSEADLKSKSKKFLIKDDVALVLRKRKGWYKIFFYHQKFQNSTILWIKEEDVEGIT